MDGWSDTCLPLLGRTEEPAASRTEKESSAAESSASSSEKPGEKRKAAEKAAETVKKAKPKPRGPGAAISQGRVPSGVISVGRAAAPAESARSPTEAVSAPTKPQQLPTQAKTSTSPRPSPFVALQQTILESLTAQKEAAVRAEDYELAGSLKGKIEQQVYTKQFTPEILPWSATCRVWLSLGRCDMCASAAQDREQRAEPAG
jgi:hypothetical protein